MSNLNQSGRLEPRFEMSDLKSIKVAITRRNLPNPNPSAPILRNLDEPASLNIHFRLGEGRRPIFDREDVRVNVIHIEERKILGNERDKRRSNSRSSTESELPKNRRPSPQPSGSKSRDDYKRDSRYLDSHSRISVYRASPSRSRRSRSYSPNRSRRRSPPPPSRREKSPPNYRQPRSRSPGGGGRYKEERRKSRSPPPPARHRQGERRRSRSRGRSRSYSPHRHRSPRRHDDRRRKSRSPRRRYTPERNKQYEPPMVPPYFEGAEFWVPNPMMQPRFFPPGMMPPGPFPYPYRPGFPPIMAPRVPMRPRIIYNNRPRPVIKPAEGESSGTVEEVAVSTSGEGKENDSRNVGEEATSDEVRENQ